MKAKSKEHVSTLINLLSNERIASHSLNRSPSKQTYSFPKASRFSKRRGYEWGKGSEGPDHFYNLPGLLSKQGGDIGHGKRYDFTLNRDSLCKPAPNQYNLEKKTNNESSAYSFAPGRGNVKFGNMFSKAEEYSPGPAQYSLPDTKSQIYATLKSRNPSMIL